VTTPFSHINEVDGENCKSVCIEVSWEQKLLCTTRASLGRTPVKDVELHDDLILKPGADIDFAEILWGSLQYFL
jgi:hypothetical protein